MHIDSSIKAVTFDVGGTLLEPWPSVGHIYAQVAAEFGLRVAPDDLTRQFNAAWRTRAAFDYSQDAWRNLVNHTFDGLLAEPPCVELFHRLYARFEWPEAWRVFDDVRPTLESLRRLGIRLGIISNWDERLRPLLGRLQLSHYFTAVIISSEADCLKPQHQIFHRAVECLELPPSAVLHVGDTVAEDCAGAERVGLKALLLDRQGNIGAGDSQTISSLAAMIPSRPAWNISR